MITAGANGWGLEGKRGVIQTDMFWLRRALSFLCCAHFLDFGLKQKWEVGDSFSSFYIRGTLKMEGVYDRDFPGCHYCKWRVK